MMSCTLKDSSAHGLGQLPGENQAWGTHRVPASPQVWMCSCPADVVQVALRVPTVRPQPGLTLHWHCPLVLLQSGSKPLLTAQWQGPHTGFPHQPLGHGRSILLGKSDGKWKLYTAVLFGTRGRLEAWALAGLGLGTALPLSGLPSTGLSISSPAPRPKGPHLQGLYLQHCYFKGICLLTFFFHTEDTDEGPTQLPRDTVSARSLCPAPPHHDPGSWGCGGWGA